MFDDLTFFNYDVAPALSNPGSGLPVITFINDVAPAQAMEVDESNQELPIATVKVGADYKRHIAENVSHSCVVLTEDSYFAMFECYQPSRDYGKTVYWLLNGDGIHLSWDKSTWKKIVKWTFKE